MYSVGDKVVHPGYGPGVIRDIEHRQVIGEAKRYYVIDMQSGGGTLMTPVAGAEDVGLRPAISSAAVERLFQLLREAPDPLSEDFRERQANVEDRLKIGDVFATAVVLRDLAWHGQAHGLTKRDAQLMQRAEESVGGEVALVREIEAKAAIEHMQALLAEAMREELIT
ncbi:CarD family transcriptional regulator [Chloroflexota bacterium]